MPTTSAPDPHPFCVIRTSDKHHPVIETFRRFKEAEEARIELSKSGGTYVVARTPVIMK